MKKKLLRGRDKLAKLAETLGAVPFALGLCCQSDALVVEPLVRALFFLRKIFFKKNKFYFDKKIIAHRVGLAVVVAGNHLAKGDLLADAVQRLIRVHGALSLVVEFPLPTVPEKEKKLTCTFSSWCFTFSFASAWGSLQREVLCVLS